MFVSSGVAFQAFVFAAMASAGGAEAEARQHGGRATAHRAHGVGGRTVEAKRLRVRRVGLGFPIHLSVAAARQIVAARNLILPPQIVVSLPQIVE